MSARAETLPTCRHLIWNTKYHSYTLTALFHSSRFVAVVYPLKRRLPLPRVWLVIACTWVFGVALASAQLVVGRESEFYYAGKKYHTCSERWNHPKASQIGYIDKSQLFSANYSATLRLTVMSYEYHDRNPSVTGGIVELSEISDTIPLMLRHHNDSVFCTKLQRRVPFIRKHLKASNMPHLSLLRTKCGLLETKCYTS